MENECFVLMPISKVDGYSEDHFLRVYEDIIKVGIEQAQYVPVRSDEVKETNLIHLDILKKLIDAPIAVCDLSTRNPNVLFELGIRQAFDKPVVLIQEKGTPKIFDINPLRYLEYSKEMKYHEVLKTQKELKQAIEATKAAENDNGNINSIVRLLALSSATIPNMEGNNKEALTLDIIQSQMNDLRQMMEMSMFESKNDVKRNSIAVLEYERISNKLEFVCNSRKLPLIEKLHKIEDLMRECDMIAGSCESRMERNYFRQLMDRIHRKMQELHENM